MGRSGVGGNPKEREKKENFGGLRGPGILKIFPQVLFVYKCPKLGGINGIFGVFLRRKLGFYGEFSRKFAGFLMGRFCGDLIWIFWGFNGIFVGFL